MNITENIKTGTEYYLKRTEGWDWFGTPRWWEVFVEFSGLNGSGGIWLIERWRWNGSSQNIREHIRTLKFEKSQEIIQQVETNLRLTAPE